TRTTEKVALETHGTAIPLPAAAGMTLNGTASMTRKLTGVTEVVVAVFGLAPGMNYAAHVHNQPCSADSGGSHYEIDKAAAAGPENEITLALVANAEGSASASTFTAHMVDADAESVVFHASDGSRLVCFDLE